VPIAVLQELCYEAESAVVAPEDHVSLPWRLGNALVSYVTYLGKTVWPTGLIPLYLHPKDSLPVGHIIGAAVLLVCISAAALALWRRCPYLLIGWLWYLGILLPASGVVEFGYGLQAMADRFTYLPQIGLYLAFVWAVADLCRRWSFRRWACGGASVLALAIFMGCAWRQTSFWRDSTTLWTHAVACSPQTMLVHRLLGSALLDQRRTREAVQQLREALELKPHSVTTNYNLGTALAAAGRLDEAIFYYRRALEIRPDFAIAHCALASALTQQGRLDEALAHYRRSVELQPNDALAHEGMGGILVARGQFDEALPHCQRAIEIRPNLAMAHNSLGNILASRGKFDEALMHYQTALQVRPDFATAYTSIGNVLAARGQFREALDHYQKALKVQPQDPSAPYSLAWLRATCPDASIRNSEEAIELAQRASRLSGGQQPQTFDALAAAYAEAGWFPEALATARKALELARQQNNRPLADALEHRIAQYEAGRPYRQTPLAPASP
jgi:tetratricopeptide (TPR) repeat protein